MDAELNDTYMSSSSGGGTKRKQTGANKSEETQWRNKVKNQALTPELLLEMLDRHGEKIVADITDNTDVLTAKLRSANMTLNTHEQLLQN